MTKLQTKLPSDTWVTATWEEYIQTVENPDNSQAKCYYYNQQLRLEMSPVSPDHAKDNEIITYLIKLFSLLKNIPMTVLGNCSYRQTGISECQPDASAYIGERAKLAPKGKSVVNLETNSPPDLIIEVAVSSLLDDLGKKRLLYEDIGVSEYWVLDVENAQITAFKIIPNGSQRIEESVVLPGLKISLLEEALQRSRQEDHTAVGSWFFQTLQTSEN